MSKAFYKRVEECASSGVSSRRFKSTFGEAILKKFGWNEGKGLGRDEDGLKDCIQVKRRQEEFLGLGATEKASGESQWKNWWDGMYDSVASKLTIDKEDSTCSSSDSETEQLRGRAAVKKGKLLRIKKQRDCKAIDKASPSARSPPIGATTDHKDEAVESLESDGEGGGGGDKSGHTVEKSSKRSKRRMQPAADIDQPQSKRNCAKTK